MFFIKLFERFILGFSEIATYLFVLAALCLLIACHKDGGWSGVGASLSETGRVLVNFIPILIAFFIITGSINYLSRRHPEQVKSVIAGEKGKFLMCVLSASMTGPAGGKQLCNAWNNKSLSRTNIFLCLTAMMALGINIFAFRAKVLGGPLTLIWLGMGLAFLFEVWAVCKWKPWSWFGLG